MVLVNNRVAKNEEKASRHINVIGHYDADTLMDKNNRLIKIIKLSGIDFVTKDEQMLDAYKQRRNSLLKSLSSEFALYFWEIKRKSNLYPDGDFKDAYSAQLNEDYMKKIKETEMFHTEHYIAILTKRPEGLFNKSFNLLEQFSHAVDKEAVKTYVFKRSKELNDVTRNVLSTLSDYKCELLGVYSKNGVDFSLPLQFISQLISFDQASVPLVHSDVAAIIPRKRLFFNRRAGVIEMRNADGSKKVAAVLAIKGYQPVTYQGVFDEFGLLKIEYVITQSFRPFDSHVAKTKLRDQQKDMLQSKDESITQADQISEAFDNTASGDVGYGLHHLTVVCYADSQEELNKYVGLITSRFSDLDISCVREDIASESSFWAQLPANFGYILRSAVISTKNMASFASLHNYSIGSASGNHWGDAVTVFETLSGSPYYFNFHYKDVGNFLVFGAMGSGKTVLVGFLIAQSMKYGGKRVIFDKDRGLEILVRALGGVYETIKPGIPTGFNPCQLQDTPSNRKFISSLLSKMLAVSDRPLSAYEAGLIESVIEGMFRMDLPLRRFCHIASFFGTKKDDSLRARFDQWHSGGAHAWLFDNERDSLNLSPDVIGFDLGHILSAKECNTPALMYLTYRVEQAIEGHRGMLFCDEGWKMLGDAYFKGMINDWSRTPRKKNNIFGLATQVANDTVSESISKAINESAFCKVFFPNPSADRKVYIDDLGLTEHEYQLIKTLADDKHYFLLNHGRGANKQSVIVRLNLTGLENHIAVISAREESLALLDQIRVEVGNDPMLWLPLFQERSLRKVLP